MKKLVIILVGIALLLPATIGAQEAEMPTSSTLVTNALAQLPASNVEKYNEIMGELASTGAEGIIQLGGMLVPADKGANAITEYALNGVAAYVTAPENRALKEGVRVGLITALENCTDNPNKAFLITLLQMCSAEENLPVFLKYMNDPYLADWAANGLITLPHTEAQLLELMQTEDTSLRAALAYAAELKEMKEAEPILLEWLKQADEETTTAIHKALARCGTSAAIQPLCAAAKAVDYGADATVSTDSYLILLNKLVEKGDKQAAYTAAKKLLKETDRSNVRSAALHILFATHEQQAKQYVMEAMHDADRAYRVAALREVEAFANEDIYASLANLLTSKEDKEVKEDILNWLGTNHVASQIDAIILCMDAANEGIAQAAIKAAGKIGGEKALHALVAQLSGAYSTAATDALLTFNGRVNEAIAQALNAETKTQIQALKIAGKRHMVEVAKEVFDLLDSPDSQVRATAYETLVGISTQADFERLSLLLEQADSNQVPFIQQAMKKSIFTLPQEEQYRLVMPYMQKSANASLYYPLLAQVGNSAAIADILKGYHGTYKNEAFQALLDVNNKCMIEVLYRIASTDEENAAAAWLRYNRLVSNSDYSPTRKYQLYRSALEITDNEKVQNELISSLAEAPIYQSLMWVEKYIENPLTAISAAYAIRNIVSQNRENFGGIPVRNALEKAKAKLAALDDADAGYMVDDINTMLAKLPSIVYNPMFGGAEKWIPMAVNHSEKAKMKASALKKLEAKAAEVADQVWKESETGFSYSGDAESMLATDKVYENFELTFEWKGKGALGIRSIPAIQLGGENSGTLYANAESKDKPEQCVDNAEGEWNMMDVKVVNDRVTIYVNGTLTTADLILENLCNPAIPAYPKGQILLVGKGEPLEVREMYLRELIPEKNI